MKQNNDILEKAGGKTGYTVPENYFDSVRSKILANLPEYPKQEAPKLSTWRRMQPYLYGCDVCRHMVHDEGDTHDEFHRHIIGESS